MVQPTTRTNLNLAAVLCSHWQVRHLRISEKHKSYNPHRWVRYVTQSSSYVCRM